MKSREVIRPKSNLVFAVFGNLALLAHLVQVIFYPRDDFSVANIFATIGLALIIYFFWIRPKIELEEAGVRVVNPFKTSFIRYQDIESIDTQWALLLHHNGRKTRAWAAPASGRYAWAAGRLSDFHQASSVDQGRQVEFINASQSELSHSGAAAIRIRRKMSGH